MTETKNPSKQTNQIFPDHPRILDKKVGIDYTVDIICEYRARKKIKRLRWLTKTSCKEAIMMWWSCPYCVSATVRRVVDGKLQQVTYQNPNRPAVEPTAEPHFWQHWTWQPVGVERKKYFQTRDAMLRSAFKRWESHPHFEKLASAGMPFVAPNGQVFVWRNGKWQRHSGYEQEPPEPFDATANK